jgi:hypothetical protein
MRQALLVANASPVVRIGEHDLDRVEMVRFDDLFERGYGNVAGERRFNTQ